MIEFLTLFLNLVSGEHQIELAVSPQVAVVEIHADRRQRLLLEGPPWSFSINLGDTLEPHLLEAVARDGKGRELEVVCSSNATTEASPVSKEQAADG